MDCDKVSEKCVSHISGDIDKKILIGKLVLLELRKMGQEVEEEEIVSTFSGSDVVITYHGEDFFASSAAVEKYGVNKVAEHIAGWFVKGVKDA